MTDDELEARLRDALATRDPGTSAPVSLRQRVARVPSSRAGGRSPRATRTARAVGTILATAAAVVIGLIGVDALRMAGSAPTGPGVAPSPSATVGPGHVPITAPMPLALEPWMASAILGALVIAAWFVVEGLSGPAYSQSPDGIAPWRFPRGLGWLGRTPIRRVALSVALIIAIGAPTRVEMVARLGPGTVSQTSIVNLLGGRMSYLGTRDALFYSASAGSGPWVGFSIRNDGSTPLTVLGLDPSVGGNAELRRFAVEAQTYEEWSTLDQSVDASPTVPFTPFELLPGDERFLVFVEQPPDCVRGPTPSSSQGPQPSLDMENYNPSTGDSSSSFNSVIADTIRLRFSAVGIAETATIPLFETIVVICPH